jgi:hypothetical protein
MLYRNYMKHVPLWEIFIEERQGKIISDYEHLDQ